MRLARAVVIALSVSLGVMAARVLPAEAAAPHHLLLSEDAIVQTARAYLGSRYAEIGDEPQTGFSCIGFAHFVYAQHGIRIPETLAGAYAASPHVPAWALQPGDLLFFANTVWPGLSHVEVYIGRGRSIGADNDALGVHLNDVRGAYWHSHYVGATRPLAGVW